MISSHKHFVMKIHQFFATGTNEVHPLIKVKNKVRATKNFIKDKITGRVDILWHIFEKKCKKLTYAFFSTMHRRIWTIPVILSFMKFFVTRTLKKNILSG